MKQITILRRATPSIIAVAISIVRRILSAASGCLAMLSSARLAILPMPKAVLNTIRLALSAAATIEYSII